MIIEIALYLLGSFVLFIVVGKIMWRTKIDRFVNVTFLMVVGFRHFFKIRNKIGTEAIQKTPLTNDTKDE